MRYLLDTNICIYLIRRKDARLLWKVQSYRAGDIGISAITVAELEYGVAKSAQASRNRVALASFLAPLDVLDFDREAAVEYGSIRAWLEKEGAPVGPMDLLIASQAVAGKIVLVTNDEKEFRKVPGLHIQNWAA